MIASSQVGEKLIFTKVQMGDGIIGETEDIQDFISLKQPKMDLTIQKSENKGNGQIEIVAVVDNSGLTSGFFGRELGLFAKIGDLGEEKLYCYTNSGTQADYISADPIEDGTPYKDFIAIDAVIGSSQNVTVVVDESKIYVTEERLESHNEDPNAHKDLLEKLPSGVPTGTIIPWAGTTPPPGFMECNGAGLSTTTYSGLFKAIGYTWGGSGNVFNLPDFVSAARFLRSRGNGLSVGDVQEDAIRNITGWASFLPGGALSEASGAFFSSGSQIPRNGGAGTGFGTLNLDAGSVVPTADENRPKSAVVMYCIKVADEYINPEQVDISEVARGIAEISVELDNRVKHTDFAQDFTAGNGWVQLPNGLILQWGVYESSSNIGQGQIAVTLPIAFPNSAFCAIPMITNMASSATLEAGVQVVSVSTDSVVFYYQSYTSGAAGTKGFRYFVIGF